jgi:Helix-turn-helix domain
LLQLFTLLTVKELAEELRMSPKSIQRPCRKGEIPYPLQWLFHMAWFDLAKVRRAVERNGRGRMRHLNANSKQQRATGGDSRQRKTKSPQLVKYGRSWQMVGQEIFINEPDF